MKTIIAAIALLAALPAQAGDLFLDINGYSFHSNETYKYNGKREKFNSQNAGVGLTYGMGKYIEASAGYFRNSFDKDTIYGSAKLKYSFNFGEVSVTPGINIGLATGYMDTPVQSDQYQVVVMPTLRLTYRGVGLTLGYFPQVEKENFIAVSVITAQINVRIGRF